MNQIAKRILLFSALFCACLSAADVNVVQFGSIKAELSFEAAPNVLRSGGSSHVYGSGGAVFINKRWLAVHVTFVPGVIAMKRLAKNQGNAKNVQGMTGRWIDDVKMRVRIAFPTDNIRKSNAVYAIFEGETVFWTLRLDGKRHSAMMFVPPQMLDRYATRVNKNRKEIPLALSEYKVLVEFSDSKGNFLGRATDRSGGKNLNTVELFESLVSTPGTMIIKGVVLPRNKTPWAWHMSSTFDYIKDTGDDSGKN